MENKTTDILAAQEAETTQETILLDGIMPFELSEYCALLEENSIDFRVDNISADR